MVSAVCLAEFHLTWLFLMVIKGRLCWDMAVCHLLSAVWTWVATLVKLSLGALWCCLTQGQELAWGCASQGTDGVCPPPQMHHISFRKNIKHRWKGVHQEGCTSLSFWWHAVLVLTSGCTRTELFLPVKLSRNSELPGRWGKLWSHSSILGRPPGVIPLHCVSRSSTGFAREVCVCPVIPGPYAKVVKVSQCHSYVESWVCFSKLLVNYSLQCYVAVLWSKISSCLHTVSSVSCPDSLDSSVGWI